MVLTLLNKTPTQHLKHIVLEFSKESIRSRLIWSFLFNKMYVSQLNTLKY